MSFFTLSCSNDASSASPSSTTAEVSFDCTVTFDTKGGSTIEPESVAYGSSLSEPLSPYKTGYTFSGWYYIKDGVESKFYFSQAITEDIIIFAKWTVHSYTVSFNSNGAVENTGSMNSLSCTYDKEYQLPENTYTNKGADFLGWAESADSESIKYNDAASFKNLTSKNGGEITLYALWSKNGFHIINYNLNGGTFSSEYQRKFLEDASVTLSNPLRSGYIFSGWYLTEDFSGDQITGWAAGVYKEDVSLYAKWTECTYKVTLDNLGQTQTLTAEYGDYLSSISIPSITGGTFGGYYTEKYGKGIQYINAAGIGCHEFDYAEDITLYAAWTFTISYQNISFGINRNPTSYNGESDVLLSDLQWREGYVFKGWSDENGEPITKIPAGSSGKRVITSNGLEIITYTITYNLNGGSWDTADTEDTADDYIPPESYNITSASIYLPTKFDVKKSGYVFDGWYTSEDFTTERIYQINTGSVGNKVLYAKWAEE
ncbi:MAG: InlB B-repeat-containing protein [Treponema sp.]|nr:InlB B-repeat-containing protein [Treponema sp.]